jgi:nicotinate (nicotinamide) nucleotide adenylyltransferase
MQFYRRTAGKPSTLGILPGTFNPVTVAHLALAEAGLRMVDQVLLVLPRILPHKNWTGASFDDRLSVLLAAVPVTQPISISASDRGLFVEIADECREAYGSDTGLSFLCGADAAQRIANWDYGDPAAFARMMRQFDLLVAERGDKFELPHRPLRIDSAHAYVSASEVRDRIARGDSWEHLVPAAIREQVRKIYGSAGSSTGSPTR